MKLDKVNSSKLFIAYNELELTGVAREQDKSGTIERDEFLALPQVSSNPLATRYEYSYLSASFSPRPSLSGLHLFSISSC